MAQHTSTIDDTSDIIVKLLSDGTFRCMENRVAEKSYQQIIIRTQAEYEQMQKQIKSHQGTHCTFPEINFEQHDLLGYYTGGNNYCRIAYEHSVTKKVAQKKYIYRVKIDMRGWCKRMSRWYWHWVLVPELPEGYEVTFETKKSHKKH